MWKALFAVVALLVGVSASLGQTETPWAEKLFDRKTEHDFGTVARGTHLNHKFVFKNIYAVPLDVAITHVSCNVCTKATPSTLKIEPRGTGYIDVNMDASLFTGVKSVYIRVTFTNPEFYSTANLHITANSRPDIVYNPGEVNFGVVSQGQGANQIITVDYAGTAKWQVNDVVTNGLPVDAKLEQQPAAPGRVSYKVSISLKPDTPAGSLKGEMFLKTNDANSPLLPVLIEANVQAALTVAPRAARVNVKVNETARVSVAVRGNSNKAFRILSVEGLGDGLTLANDLPDAPAEIHRLTLLFKKGSADEGFHRKIEITTDLQKTPVTVTVDGSVSEK